MNRTIISVVALFVGISSASADQVVTDKMQSSFSSCVIANGFVLAELKAKGIDGDVIVNAPAAKTYIAKAAINGRSALLMCEGAHQTIVITE